MDWLCTLCHQESAAYACICDFPLPKVCSVCDTKHKFTQGSHFALPLHAVGAIAQAHWLMWHNYLVGISRIEKKLLESLHIFATIEAQVEDLFFRVQSELSKVKSEYAEQLRELQAAAHAAVTAALEEVNAHVVDSTYSPTDPIVKSIFEAAAAGNIGDVQLFEVKTNEVSQETLKQVVGLRIETLVWGIPVFRGNAEVQPLTNEIAEYRPLPDVLPSWDALVQPMEQLSLAVAATPSSIRNLESVEQSQVAEIGNVKPPDAMPEYDIPVEPHHKDKRIKCDKTEPPSSQNTQRKKEDVMEKEEEKRPAALHQSATHSSKRKGKCQTCGSRFTNEDKGYQCREACQCRLCTRQWIVGNDDNKHCSICRSQYSEEAINLASRGFRKCHNCCIVVTTGEMDTIAPCGEVCRNCVVLEKKTVLGLTYSIKGKCRCAPDRFFDVETAYIYETARTSMGMSSCCFQASETVPKLRCGHFLCKAHIGILQFCRRCQGVAHIQE